MGKDSTRQGVLFKGLSKKAVTARFDQEQANSDGGVVLLKACDERLGLSAAMAACLRDDRQQSGIVRISRLMSATQSVGAGIKPGERRQNQAALLAS